MIHKFEKADVCDLGAISVELSKEDEELFVMFKGRNRPKYGTTDSSKEEMIWNWKLS